MPMAMRYSIDTTSVTQDSKLSSQCFADPRSAAARAAEHHEPSAREHLLLPPPARSCPARCPLGRAARCGSAYQASPLCFDRRSVGLVSGEGGYAIARQHEAVAPTWPTARSGRPCRFCLGCAARCDAAHPASPLSCDPRSGLSVSGQSGVPLWPNTTKLSRHRDHPRGHASRAAFCCLGGAAR